MKDPLEELAELVTSGLAANIRQIEEAVALHRKIGALNSENSASAFMPLFSRLRILLSKFSVITTIHLFDPPNDDYPCHSIPTILNHMRYTADYLPVANRDYVIERLMELGHPKDQFEGIPDPWITQLVRKEFKDRLPISGNSDSNELSNALESLIRVRDTIVSEAADWKSREKDIAVLLEYAKYFASIIGKGYLNNDYLLEDGTSIFLADANQSTDMITRLLNKAGIILS